VIKGRAVRFQNLILSRVLQVLVKVTRAVVIIAYVVLATHSFDEVEAATPSNARAAVGMNLEPVNYYSAEQPFLNILKTTGITQSAIGWSTNSSSGSETNEEQYLQLDSSGYPTTLKASSADSNQQFTQACSLFLRNLPGSNAGTGPGYRAGQYVALYDGQGTLSFNFDAKAVSSSAGQYVFNVATPTWGGGVWMCITSTDPNHTGNYLRNIRVVYSGDEASLNAGNVFSSSFLTLTQNFKVLRFMDWLETNNNPPGDWNGRPQPTDAGWGTRNGVPFEAIFELCNAVNADCWVNVPHTADDNYITQLAMLAHSMLGTSQQLYIELSNEVWNSAFPQYQYAIQQGLALWPSNTNAFTANRNWYGMRTAQMCDIVASVWGGDFSRVHCVLGAQAANSWTATEALSCPLWSGAGNAPCAAHHITDVAIAPYFGFSAPASWSSNSQSTNLNLLFQELNQGGVVPGGYAGGELKQQSDSEAAYVTALAPFKLPLIAYEGGQTFVSFPNGVTNGSNNWLTNLYIAANRDPRMGAAYTQALNNWKSNGGHVYLPYNDIGAPSQYGEWGALESFMDTVSPLSSAPAKWQAIQNFLSGNACWWSACVGSIGGSVPAVPKPPSNITVN
jgi:hypothetical protein